jgi:RecA-family ATPase
MVRVATVSIDNLDELEAWQPPYRGPDIISAGIMYPGTAMIIFGPPKSWKSMTTIYTGFQLAEGKDWFGFHTSPCVVFIYQVELPKVAFKKRMMKYKSNAPFKPSTLLCKTETYIKLDSTYGKDSLNADIVKIEKRFPERHIVVILDPLYLLMSGHVNDEYDVKRLLDHLNELRSRHNISFILIHHTHKVRMTTEGEVIDTGSDEMMGSSYLNNWCDTQMRLERLNPTGLDNKISITFPLHRNAEDVLPRIKVEWDRKTLQPSIIESLQPEISEEDVSTRGLKHD